MEFWQRATMKKSYIVALPNFSPGQEDSIEKILW